jgi:serine/threonine protein phosphatase PrpC
LAKGEAKGEATGEATGEAKESSETSDRSEQQVEHLDSLNLTALDLDAGVQIQRKKSSVAMKGKLARSLSLNYEQEVDLVKSNPSPMSRSNFRKRRLTYAQRKIKLNNVKEVVGDKTVFSAGEIGDSSTTDLSPFDKSIVGTYSCHGIEPAYDEVDRTDVVVDKINQDRGCVVHPFGQSNRQALFCAFDGHGEFGDLVSNFTMIQVQERLEGHPKFDSNADEDIAQAFKDVFNTVDRILPDNNIDCYHSGTTAVCVLMRTFVDKDSETGLNTTRLHVANAGDSRAVMAKKNRDGMIVSHDLSVDQNPNHPVEQARIEAAGGFVSPPPEEGLSARVWLDPEFRQVGLAMGRSIGDHAVSGVGVIAEPEVTTYDISADDEFMILASDGVWEFITSAEAVNIIQRDLHRGAHKACEELIETAKQRWRDEEGDYRDDITAVVVKIHDLWPLDEVEVDGGDDDGGGGGLIVEGDPTGDEDMWNDFNVDDLEQ